VLSAGACSATRRPTLEQRSASTTQPLVIASPTTAPLLEEQGDFTTVAQARGSWVPVFDTTRSRARVALLSPQPSGAPLVFVVVSVRRPWLKVLLPVRPNGSVGWIPFGAVTLSHHRYRIVVNLRTHRITVWRGLRVIDTEPVGVGKGRTPTPGGKYYTKELFRPSDPNGAYGPYAYGLSGFSNVITRFAGGNGVIGIHGTNQPWLIGHDVSHGCIRMSNAGITKLARTLPLGVPVVITR
jgi:lipoprotein-anchoring transpeptidase ErfK/SrfK